MSKPSATDDRTEDELLQEIRRADWNLGRTAHTYQGVVATFRKHETSFLPGVETREVTGKDLREAMRIFLAELQEGTAP
ncbi:MAG TPA: hypothetical protein VM450_09755 [Thermomicrobiales bacterium]|nr:hypothetical protein [Thermomicrobiales bacterium]